MEQVLELLREKYPDRLIVNICKAKGKTYAHLSVGSTFQPFDVCLNVLVDVEEKTIKEMSFMDMPHDYDSVEYIDVENPFV